MAEVIAEQQRSGSEPSNHASKAIPELIKALVPALSAVGAGLWVAFTYLDQQQVAHA